jgi:hypothetical protein
MPRFGGPFNFRGSETDPITVLKGLIGCGRLTVDANQIIFWPTVLDSLGEERFDGRAFFDYDVVSEAAAVIVDE